MRTFLHLVLVLFLFESCKDENELPRFAFEINLEAELVGNRLLFQILSNPNISENDLRFYLGNQEVYPQKMEDGSWQIDLNQLPAGTYQLKVSQKSIPENSKIRTFSKVPFLLELELDESLFEEGINHFLVIWDRLGQTLLVDMLTTPGNHRVPLGDFSDSEFSMGIFTQFEAFSQGLGQVFDQVPLGKHWPLRVEKDELPPFGTATLKFGQIPTHDEYWIGSRGSFSHGQALPRSLPLFLDVIPTRFFVKLKQNQKTFGHFFPQQVNSSGDELSLSLSELELLVPKRISFSKPLSGSYSVYGFETASNLKSQIFLDLGPLEEANFLDMVDYAALFPKIEFQLNYLEEDFQVFSRFRDAQFPSTIQPFDGNFIVQEDESLMVTGTVDLVFSSWTGTDSNGKNWLVLRLQGKDQGRLQSPNIQSDVIHLQGVTLTSVSLEESDLLENYSEFLTEFTQGKSRDYFQKSGRFHFKFKSMANSNISGNWQDKSTFSRFSLTYQLR